MTSELQNLALQRYRRMAWITLAAVYFLILVGASVRASGAGMGCPDWPTCFGQWIPPTSEAQLPDNYQEIYAELGYADTRFNVVKTWTEYTNRLVGVTIGFLIFLTAVFSWYCREHDSSIFKASVGAFLMVGFQGWLGAQVVGSNLQPGLITLHMLVALALVGTLLFAVAQARRGIMASQPVTEIAPEFQKWLYVVLVLTVIQVAMGTQVREMTDFISRAQGEELRSSWIEAMPWFFYVHRSFSAVVLFSNLWLGWLLVTSLGWQHTLTRLTLAMIAVICTSVVSGATLGHLGMPAFVQPTHLLAASLLFGLQFLIWMSYRHSRDAAV
ncbi:MAG: heme A synthase [SAR86 cluster bacterium]|uniref:Heme A synthase n=1 Tax=SAR86 cluster bacterium TaxID=2030880 RepID=A0A2A5B549_9GAMM|nr:MAG: heme A synthase [SAR86 cluster bacterium]